MTQTNTSSVSTSQVRPLFLLRPWLENKKYRERDLASYSLVEPGGKKTEQAVRVLVCCCLEKKGGVFARVKRRRKKIGFPSKQRTCFRGEQIFSGKAPCERLWSIFFENPQKFNIFILKEYFKVSPNMNCSSLSVWCKNYYRKILCYQYYLMNYSEAKVSKIL